MATEITHRMIASIPIYLDGIIFPASRDELLQCAEDNYAPDVILDAIEKLPELRYWSIREVLAKIAVSA